MLPIKTILHPTDFSDASAHALKMAAMVISALSVGYAIRNPWSHPWILDAMEHLNLYELKR